MKGNLRQSRILDFTLWISVSRYWIPDSLSVELGFQIAIVGGIPDSLRWIPDSRAQDFWFHKSGTQNTLRPKTEFTSRDDDSGIWGIFACGPESWALECRVQLKGSGIPALMMTIRNPVPGSKTVFDFPYMWRPFRPFLYGSSPAILGDIFVT